MNVKKCLVKSISTLLFFSLISACGKVCAEENARLVLDKTETEIFAGESVRLHAVLENFKATPALVWRSSDDAVARVEDGLVFGVAAGEACVSVQTRENTASCKVIVKPRKTEKQDFFKGKGESCANYIIFETNFVDFAYCKKNENVVQ